MTELHGDIESRSILDVTDVGVYVYSAHPSTEITMFAYEIDAGPTRIWYPPTTTHTGEPMPDDLRAALTNPALFVAHNAGFERIMLNGPPGQRIGVPSRPRLEQWECTAARAARAGLPRSLEGAAMAAGLASGKDVEGGKLMKTMAKPLRLRKQDIAAGVKIRWRDGPDDMRRLGLYCMQDVRVERDLDSRVPRLTPFERQVWEMTERINDRGLLIDEELLLLMLSISEQAAEAMAAELAQITGGAVRAVTQVPAMKAWLETQGVTTASLAKADLADLLVRDDLPPVVRRVLQIRRDGGKASVSKYEAIRVRRSSDGVVRGAMVYCGAASTGRWSSRGVQAHNLVRPSILKKLSIVERMIDTLRQGATLAEFEDLHGSAMPIAAEMLRPIIIARSGSHLVRGDSKQIEARVNPWLAGAQWKLDAFERYDAGTGPDLYKVAAAGIYKTDPDDIGDEDPRRQIGKVSELALGFEGGASALQSMARNYPGVTIPHHEWPPGVEWDDREPAPDGSDEWIKALWRESNPEIRNYWRDLKFAAIRCMECAPGQEIEANQFISFRRSKTILRMRLPSGTALYYRDAALQRVRMPWGEWGDAVTYYAEDSQTKQWRQFTAYGGLWCENSVQATARDLMAFWQLQFAAAGIEPVLSVHDEGIGEAQMRLYPRAEDAAAEVTRIMRTLPKWASGLPVNADATAGPRYVKG